MINPDHYRYPLGRSGTAENPICYFGYPEDVRSGKLPVLDCQHHCENADPGNYGYIYNSAIKDAHAYLSEKLVDMEMDLYAEERTQ